MKIIHIINNISVRRGAERLVTDLINHTNHYLIIWHNNTDFAYKINKKRVIILNGYIELILFLLTNYKKYNLFHYHLFPSFYFSIFTPFKSVIHEHGNGVNNRRNKSIIFTTTDRIVYKLAYKIICINKDSVNNLTKHLGYKINNIFVLHNFVTPNLNSKNNIQNYHKKDIIRIGMVAAFDNNKDHILLLNAFSKLPNNYHLILAGSGKKLIECKLFCIEHGFIDRVSFFGDLKDVSFVYSLCNFMILISKHESFGLVVLEAAVFRKRTICSDIDCLRDTCINKIDLVENNVEAIQKKIIDFNPTIKTNFDHILEVYSIDKYIINLEKIYKA